MKCKCFRILNMNLFKYFPYRSPEIVRKNSFSLDAFLDNYTASNSSLRIECLRTSTAPVNTSYLTNFRNID